MPILAFSPLISCGSIFFKVFKAGIIVCSKPILHEASVLRIRSKLVWIAERSEPKSPPPKSRNRINKHLTYIGKSAKIGAVVKGHVWNYQ